MVKEKIRAICPETFEYSEHSTIVYGNRRYRFHR